MRVSRGVTISLLTCGLLAVPVVSFTVLGGGEPATLDSVALDGVDRSVLQDAPSGLVVAADAHSPEEAPEDAPEVVPTDAEPAVLTAPLDTEEFAAVGFTWDAASSSGVVVQARVREADGWSEWFALPASDEGPDAGTASAARAGTRTGTDLLLTAGADGVQVRADAASGAQVEGLKAVLIDPGEPDGAQPVQIAGASPGVITRAQWGAGGTPTGDCAPAYAGQLKAAIIHHTVSTNSYSAAQASGLVRSIWLYHTRPPEQGGRGWCDIGYNAVVDRHGQVFEGAAGGLDRNVIGAHAGGFNTYTVGVSTLGEFESAAPTGAMTEAVAQTIAWKFGLEGLDARGTTQLTSGGGGTAKYAKGTVVTLPVIMGHRDVGATACPGQHLYDQVGAIRARVADLLEDQGRNLLRTPENGTVYVVSGSSKYAIADMATLGALAPLGPVGYVSQQYLDRRTTVSLMSRVVLAPDGTVYFIDAGIRLPFSSCGQVADYGASCASLVRLEQSLIDAFHPGPMITPIYRTTSGKTFYVSGGVKREVVDELAQAAAGLPTAAVRLMETGLSYLPYGAPVIRDGVLLRSRSSQALVVAAGGQLTSVSGVVTATALSGLPVRELDEASLRLLPAAGSVPGVFVREAGGPRVFLLTEAGKRVVDAAVMVPASVPEMPVAVLALMPDAPAVAAGTFVKGSGNGTVFAVNSGVLRGIGGWGDLIALNGGNVVPQILTVDQRIADSLPRGPLQRRPGTMVVSPGNATVFLVDGYDALIPVGSFAVTTELGATSLVSVPAADLAPYTVRPGSITPVLECAGVRYLGLGGKLYRVGVDAAAHYPATAVTTVAPSTCAALPSGGDLSRFLWAKSGTIYYVENGVKRPITSWQTYLNLGGASAQLIAASDWALSLVPTGPAISAAVEAAATPAAGTQEPAGPAPTGPAPSTDDGAQEPTTTDDPTGPVGEAAGSTAPPPSPGATPAPATP
jgi:hypothetical protein